jgi:hypothetical protein
MMHYDWGMHWSGMVLGPVVMIAVLAATVVVAVLLDRWLGGDMTIPPRHCIPQATV